MELDASDFGVGDAIIVRCRPGQDLMSIPAEEFQSLVRSSGAILFKDFDADALSMMAFAERFSIRFNRDRLRVPIESTGGHVQLVTEGMGYIEPHAEQANSPFRPDAIWFCCGIPAETAGETLFWDGVELWRRLSPEAKLLFGSKRLRYFQKYRPDQWRLFLGDSATIVEVQQTLAGREGVSAFVNPDESIYLEYLCSAVIRTRYGAREAFANGLLTERKNTLGGLMSFEDGTLVHDGVIAEVEQTINEIVGVIDWQQGDLLFLDNTRYMHGRNAFTDKGRRIFSSMSFLNF
ncbi:TauD/TfdA family dioxygenase [Bradyrhizobium sp. 156]|uniref:TauD/TfdA family dioxygenase n=1 Tax=Bradyrhizobium sp. 156 TaxID=2782630 RepID=UPI001FFBC8CC|nr:TauD/TfdA family dioxygenase [Bradyrhizobium sp. 156]MCK1326625.1 TauD/TfdA family dioxygenase [Bradyrhizobium sp. 156]